MTSNIINKPTYSLKRIQALKQADYGINIFEGAVRSGKTYDTCTKFLEKLDKERKSNVEHAIFGKTDLTIKRNIISTFEQIIGHKEIKQSTGFIRIFGQKIYTQGLNDIRAEGKIKGMTIKNALGDEMTEWQESQFNMIMTRQLTFEDSWFGGTTNPDSPMHWMYKRYGDLIGNGLQTRGNVFVAHYALDDNLLIPDSKKQQLKNDYTGVFYLRNIEGLWVIAEGLVVPEFSKEIHLISREQVQENILKGLYKEYIGACDWGFSHAMAAGVLGVTRDNKFHLLWEFYETKKLTQDVSKWFQEKQKALGKKLNYIFCDSAESDRIQELVNDGLNAYLSEKAINAGLNTINTGFKNNEILLCDDCVNIQNELLTLRYPQSGESGFGDEKKFIGDDHAVDMIRYGIHSYKKDIIGL
jgi:PBSX family phage terminase large subunit